MKQCYPPKNPARLKGKDAEYLLRVSGIEAVANSDYHVIELRLDHDQQQVGQNEVFLMTPPAAHQLSKLLRHAVKDYLKSEPEKPG